jgi:hypothetical protein
MSMERQISIWGLIGNIFFLNKGNRRTTYYRNVSSCNICDVIRGCFDILSMGLQVCYHY